MSLLGATLVTLATRSSDGQLFVMPRMPATGAIRFAEMHQDGQAGLGRVIGEPVPALPPASGGTQP